MNNEPIQNPTFTVEQLRDEPAVRAAACALFARLAREEGIVLRRTSNGRDYEFVQTKKL